MDKLAMSACMEDENQEAMRSTVPRKRKADVSTFLIAPDETEWLETRKRKKYAERVSWPNPPECSGFPTAGALARAGSLCAPVMMPYFNKLKLEAVSINPMPMPMPIPNLSVAEEDDVWMTMVMKQDPFPKDKNWLRRHPDLDMRMRSLLLDWIMEVCEGHSLQRQTFYLAQEYFDRFMSTQEGITRDRLQLIGVTCLFMAAKLEEVNPPSLYRFAFITDNACTRDEIRSMEMIITKALDWRLNPLTVISWLNIYIRLTRRFETKLFMMQERPWYLFTQVTLLLDMGILDVESLQYSSRTLAAAALYHYTDLSLVGKVSGLTREELHSCIKWFVPFAITMRSIGRLYPTLDHQHNIQSNKGALQWMEKSHIFKDLLDEQQEALCLMEMGYSAGFLKWRALLGEHTQSFLLALLGENTYPSPSLLGENTYPSIAEMQHRQQQAAQYTAGPEEHPMQAQNIGVLQEVQPSADSSSKTDFTPWFMERKW